MIARESLIFVLVLKAAEHGNGMREMRPKKTELGLSFKITTAQKVKNFNWMI
jgi:hypothetical protein